MNNLRCGPWESGAFLPLISVSELTAARLPPRVRSSPAALQVVRTGAGKNTRRSSRTRAGRRV